MVAGYHLIWTVYGYWLPNAPRGSASTEIRIGRPEQDWDFVQPYGGWMPGYRG